MKDVPKHSRLQRRRSRYFLRAKVPADLVEIIGKKEIIRALGTSDHKKALGRLRVASVEVDAEFAEARRKKIAMNPGSKSTGTEPLPLADVEIHQLVRRWFEEREEDAISRLAEEPLDHAQRQDAAEAVLDVVSILSADDADEDISVIQTADAILKTGSFTLPPGRQRNLLLRLTLKAMLEGAKRDLARFRGIIEDQVFDRYFARPSPLASAASPPSSITLGRLIGKYKTAEERKTLSVKTTDGYRIIFRALEELLGKDKPIASITREDCRRAQAILTALPPNATKRFPKLTLEQAAKTAKREGLPSLSVRTARSYLNNLSALFNFAVREQYLERNPAEKLTLALPKIGKKSERQPFSPDQLTTIFQAPPYAADPEKAGKSRRELVRDGWFWVPLLALWTGMRLNECCQLHAGDIVHQKGVDMILVRAGDEADGKKVKSAAGERKIPIHPELKRLGFLNHVEKMRAAESRQLFPELPKGKNGYYSDPFSKRFGRHLTDLGITAPNVSFHSFRHNFRDALREAKVSIEYVEALGGWKRRGSAESIYGAGFDPKSLYRKISKIKYPGLDLGHLYT